MNTSASFLNLRKELEDLDDLDWIDSQVEKQKFSRDFYEYSPILREELKDCSADLVVRPRTINGVSAVATACRKFGVPLTLRGSGTGNYGQCVPLQRGVVMLMGELKKIRDFDPVTGAVTVEPGCILKDLDEQLGLYGRQLRLLPSTWRSASIGGFLAGGSGGIGSIRWGFLRDPGHLLGLEIVTLENPSKTLILDASEAEALNHSYGTNGIITAIKLSTTNAIKWQELTIDCSDISIALQILQTCSKVAVDIFLCTLLEKEIVEKLPGWSGDYMGSHRLLILVSPDGISTIQRISSEFGANCIHIGQENNKSGTGLRELSWNHTTLHMRAIDKNWTYLQMLLPQPEIKAIEQIKSDWGDDLLWHLEAVRQQGVQRVAALPLVRWKGPEELEKLTSQCKELGAVLFNPHVITVEDGGLGVIDGAQVKAKRMYDPDGLLNPGKLKGWT